MISPDWIDGFKTGLEAANHILKKRGIEIVYPDIDQIIAEAIKMRDNDD